MRSIGPTVVWPAESEIPEFGFSEFDSCPLGLCSVSLGGGTGSEDAVVFFGHGKNIDSPELASSVAVPSSPSPSTFVAASAPPPTIRPTTSATPARATSPTSTGCSRRSLGIGSWSAMPPLSVTVSSGPQGVQRGSSTTTGISRSVVTW